MAPDLAAIDLVPLLASTVFTMVMGAVWYGVFAKPWAALAHPGRSQDDLRNGPKWPYAVAAAAALLLSYAYGVLYASTGAAGIVDGLLLALAVAPALVAMYLTTYAFAHKPLKLALIDVGYYVVSLFGMAVLYSLL